MLDDKIREPLAKWLNTCVEIFRVHCTPIEDIVKDSFIHGYIDGYYTKQEEYPYLKNCFRDYFEIKEYQGPEIYLPLPLYYNILDAIKLHDENEPPEMAKFVTAVYTCDRHTESGTFIYRFAGVKI